MLRVGLIGCGNIADIYMKNAPQFKDFSIVAVSDRKPAASASLAEKFGIMAFDPKEIMKRDDIDAILNLTAPAAHADISLQAIAAGKHVFSEKPLATSLADAQAVNEAAAAKGVGVGVAPDTVFGPGIQTARRMLGEGAIGKPIAGVCAMMTRGMEHRHPNPEFFFKPGGGPVLDIGPYYLSMLVLLLGPVQRVTAVGQSGFAERIVTAPYSPRLGDRIKVEVLTTVQGVLQFEMGAQISFSFSWDVCCHAMAPLELYGSEGSMRLPDPNFFGGAIQIAHERCSWKTVDVENQPFGLPNFPEEAPTLANYRGLGLAEMANAIGARRPHRANGEFGLHVLDALLSIEKAAISGHSVDVRSRVEQPELLTEEQARMLLASARA